MLWREKRRIRVPNLTSILFLKRPSESRTRYNVVMRKLRTTSSRSRAGRFFGRSISAIFFLSMASVTGVLCALPAVGTEVSESEKVGLAEALKAGKVTVSLRYRSEWVDEDNDNESAWASTLRTTLAYRSGAFRGWSLFLEAEDITAVIDDDEYRNAGANGFDNRVRGVSVVADPQLTEMNQAYLQYSRGEFKGTFGRQEINLGDQRYVGAVGWRQNHQSFDAVRLTTQSDRVDIDYSFVENTNRIFGDNQDMSSHFLNVPIRCGDTVKSTLTIFGYLLDYERPSDALLSTLTYGAEFKGSTKLGAGPWTLGWEAEVAQQDDAGDNPRSVDAQYYAASVSAGTPGIGVDATWEVLGGDPTKGRFTTPLATLHKFNGWADKFLNTPSIGLETLYLRLKGKVEAVQWMVIYHRFTSDFGGVDFGTEWDAELKYDAPWQQTFGFKAALYEADRFSVDTEKFMLWTSYRF